MVQIYFQYEEITRQYVYIEQLIEYRMPLSLMLKFKKYLREQPNDKNISIKDWLTCLTNAELKKVVIYNKKAIDN